VLRAAGAGALADIDVHPDGRRVVAADARGQAYVWDLPSQRLQQRLGPPVPAESRGVRFHPVQPQLALATLVGGASVIALDGGAEIGNVEGSIEVLRWEPQGRLLTGGQDGVVRSHAVGTGSSVALPEPHRDAVVALAVAPAAQGTAGVVYSADTRGVIVAHGNGESGTVATATNAAGKPFSVDSLSFAPDGKRWIAAGNSGDVLVFDRTTRQVVKRLETAADQVNAAAFSPDGNFVAALDNAGRLLVWHGAELNRYATLWLRNEPGRVGTDAFGLLGQLRKLAWLPDSRRIVVATQNGAAVVVAVPIEAWLPAPR
jgi:WD40 repeat protein